jgi:hypothetical protein
MPARTSTRVRCIRSVRGAHSAGATGARSLVEDKLHPPRSTLDPRPSTDDQDDILPLPLPLRHGACPPGCEGSGEHPTYSPCGTTSQHADRSPRVGHLRSVRGKSVQVHPRPGIGLRQLDSLQLEDAANASLRTAGRRKQQAHAFRMAAGSGRGWPCTVGVALTSITTKCSRWQWWEQDFEATAKGNGHRPTGKCCRFKSALSSFPSCRFAAHAFAVASRLLRV